MKILFKILVGIFGWFVTYAFLIARTNWLFGLNSSGGGWLDLSINNQFLNFFVEIGLCIILNAFIWFKVLRKINDYRFLAGIFLAIISFFWFVVG
tara:strand:+ start:690 stop:974 length:285 start_codon:yes stop_codon:yes gene_type:complete